MNIHTLTLGLYQTNCYLLENNGQCVVIDPGYEPETILSFVKSHNLSVAGILLTHGHFDHVGAVAPLAQATACDVWLHPDELTLPAVMTGGPLFYTETYEEGDSLQLAGITFSVMHTPGHTPGSVCLVTEDAIFSGDTLFAGSIGRTDFPGSDPRQMVASLSRLSDLKKDYRIFPGHGESTTFAREKKYNPYLKGML